MISPAIRSTLIGALVLTAAASARAAGPGDLAGRWATQGFGSIVEFRPCREAPATLCGRIVWLWDPLDKAGRVRRDDRNPDPALRGRPLVGVEIVRGLRPTAAGVWSGGALYNPDDGRTYGGEIRLRSGRLELKGCAINVICQTQVWRRAEDVIAAVRAP